MIDLDALVEKSKDPLPDYGLEALQAEVHGNHRHRHHRFLYWLALETQPALSLELGSQWGVTCAHLCTAAREFGGHVVGVDVQAFSEKRARLFERLGNFTFIQSDSLDAVPAVEKLAEKFGKLGLVYQDSLHHYAHFRAEWEAYSPLLQDDTVWACNLMPNPNDPKYPHGMADYWRELPGDGRIYRDLYQGADVGVTVFRRPLTVLILAADGGYDGWEGDVPRQLVPIAGEPLLVRVIRELGERGQRTTVVTDVPEIIATGYDYFSPSQTDTIFHTLLSTRELWQGRVLVLLGDVFYTDEFYDLMFGYDGPPTCFDSFALLINENDYEHAVEVFQVLAASPGEAFFNRLWLDGHFPKVETAGHVDFDIVPYYEKFLEDNPWAR